MQGPELITLIGLPGSGKSSVGRQLARRLGWPFTDTDAVIEQRLGCTIRMFFEQHGESAFRDIEQTVIDELTSQKDGCGVLATGGGAVLRSANRTHLQQRSCVVYLRAAPNELYQRLRHDRSRPLLQVADPLAKLHDLFDQRDPLYRATAHFTLDTGQPSVATLVSALLRQLELSGNATPSTGHAETPG